MPRPSTPIGPPKVDPDVAERRERLVNLRDLLAEAVETAAHRDLAPLAARYQSVLAELAGLPSEGVSDGIDDLAGARAKRRAGVKGA